VICYTVFSPLQNGKKKVEKKVSALGEKSVTMLTKKMDFFTKKYFSMIFFIKHKNFGNL
jgi:hypothetical protein